MTCLARNPGALRGRSKHFELRWLKVQEYAAEGTIDLIQVGTKWQIADALTKWLAPAPAFRVSSRLPPRHFDVRPLEVPHSLALTGERSRPCL